MPGPGGFLDKVSQSTQEGLNVAIAMPERAAGDIEVALLESFRNRVIETVRVDKCNSPVLQVAQAIGIHEELRDIDDLFSNVRFASSDLVFIPSITSQHWTEWKRFFEDYDAISKDRPPDQRPKLLAILRGIDLPKEVTRSVTFRGFRWMGLVSELDVTLYVMERLASRSLTDGERLLASSIVAKLALGDVDLADALAERSFDDILRPHAFLREWAARHDWTTSTTKHWTAGTSFRMHGVDEVHSAILALENNFAAIDSRIWAAQAAILMPSIERERLKLVAAARRFLRPPFFLPDGEEVSNAELLEIGPLAHQMSVRGAPREMRKRAFDLKAIRNKLAHMESLSIQDALNIGLI
jgi:hypothetical protein